MITHLFDAGNKIASMSEERYVRLFLHYGRTLMPLELLKRLRAIKESKKINV